MKTTKKLTVKKLFSFSAALLMTTSMMSVYAEEGEMTQTRTQDRVRTEVNLQTPVSDFGQSLSHEQEIMQNKYQNRNQYKYMNNFQSP